MPYILTKQMLLDIETSSNDCNISADMEWTVGIAYNYIRKEEDESIQ